ncbi:MAG TPA: hypothetical protein DC054_11520 [Blastocatellia bacterium]|nr:hypothetical protein [Blastocatellia bacterium]
MRNAEKDISPERNVTAEEADNRIDALELAKTLPFRVLMGHLSEHELLLASLYYVGDLSVDQIAEKLGEDTQAVRFNLNRLKIKIRYRARRIIGSTPIGSDRLSTFKELQRRLGLTAAQADEWQNAVIEARR